MAADWHSRYRRIIDSYREALMLRDPPMCRSIDASMADKGEGWVSAGDGNQIDVNRMMSAKEIADEFGFNPWNIKDWARRHPDKIAKHQRGSRVVFRLGDVLAYQATM